MLDLDEPALLEPAMSSLDFFLFFDDLPMLKKLSLRLVLGRPRFGGIANGASSCTVASAITSQMAAVPGTLNSDRPSYCSFHRAPVSCGSSNVSQSEMPAFFAAKKRHAHGNLCTAV